MDESTKLLAEVRDLLKRADEERRVALRAAMQPTGLDRLCTLSAVLCVLLAIVTAYAAVQALDVSGYLSLAFAGGAALLLVGGVVSAWCARSSGRGGQ